METPGGSIMPGINGMPLPGIIIGNPAPPGMTDMAGAPAIVIPGGSVNGTNGIMPA